MIETIIEHKGVSVQMKILLPQIVRLLQIEVRFQVELNY